MTSLLRSLIEDEDFVYVGDNFTVTESHISSEGAFDARVFWGVNCFIVLLLTGMCVWCFYLGGKDNIVDWTNRRGDTDRQFQQTLQQRHEQRMAARRSTPAKRLARLKRSFVRHKVQMVVKEGDIVQGDDAAQRYEDMKLSQCSSEDTNTTDESATTPPDIENRAVISNVEDLEKGALPGPEADADDDEPTMFCRPINEAAEPTTQEPEGPVPVDEPPVQTEPDTTATVAMEEGTLSLVAAEGEPLNDTEIEQPTTDNDAAAEDANGMPGDMSISEYSDHPTGYLVLRPGNTTKPPKNAKMVPNCCAVCLGAYEEGDTVVWSCNPECSHAFHLDCIMEWLLKIQDGGTPCPCCRQEFTSWEKDRQERKIKWAAGHTFNTGAVSLR